MSELTVENKNGQLVVDSRLIAEELGIEHKSLMTNLESHLTEIEFAFGAVLFEISTRKDNNKGGNQPKVAYLTEDQATFLMTISRNTPQVIQAKVHLVKAFSKAKTALQSISPEVLQLLSTMTEKMNILTARTQRLDDMEKATNNHKGLKGVLDTEIEEVYPEEIEYTTKEYLEAKGILPVHLNTLRKRAIQFYRNGTQEKELPKKGSEVLFKGAAVAYLEEALKTILF